MKKYELMMKFSLTGIVRSFMLPCYLVCIFFTTLVLLAGCSGNNSTEEKIREFISNAETAIEESNIRLVGKLIAEEYSDSRGRTKKELIQYVTYQVLRKRSIHLYTSISSISFLSDQTASVELIAAMTGTPVESKRALLDMRADLYTFNCTLTLQDNKWVLSSASWEPAMLDDLLPDK